MSPAPDSSQQQQQVTAQGSQTKSSVWGWLHLNSLWVALGLATISQHYKIAIVLSVAILGVFGFVVAFHGAPDYYLLIALLVVVGIYFVARSDVRRDAHRSPQDKQAE